MNLEKAPEDVLKSRLQTIQNVMKLVKHLFEGQISVESQKSIVEQVSRQDELIY